MKMNNLYELLLELYSSNYIKIDDDDCAVFTDYSKSQITKYYAKHNNEYIDELITSYSRLAAELNKDMCYMEALKAVVYADVTNNVQEESQWIDLLDWHHTGRHLADNQSIKESTFIEDLGNSLNPNS